MKLDFKFTLKDVIGIAIVVALVTAALMHLIENTPAYVWKY